ncbi:hypothetical protein IGB42_01777 [Andreprevotia sp. IGB-42]|uniref:DUF2310 family Zn-ribbon-containing protein n=1 Tax=Andreprevotia sp. IGB-42 TaxID=2497473 RepID=UPI00135C3F27|nr:DUF2310 family Zn-ribbon-containing protein [Andreprevotia sp. IGB-42]KAF0813426.1 hypothetical protein IGB42_01777 [Andreprevotia sp. IGB-42]
MFVQQIEFAPADRAPSAALADLIFAYQGVLLRNGQVCGEGLPLWFADGRYKTTLLTPARDSLAARFGNRHVHAQLAALGEYGVTITTQVLGEDEQSVPACNCATSGGHILFTTFISHESPVRCLDCFGAVPLYTLPLLAGGEHHELISWQAAYQRCDGLQMGNTLQRAATRQLTRIDSSLSQSGIAHCRTLSALTSTPFYFYLYHASGRSHRAEAQRPCPGCGQPWLLPQPLHGLFHFRCDDCRLLSNMAWDVVR